MACGPHRRDRRIARLRSRPTGRVRELGNRASEGRDALVLTDMFGATPANIAGRLATRRMWCVPRRQFADAGACGLLSRHAARYAGRQGARGRDQGVCMQWGPPRPPPVACAVAVSECLPVLPPETAPGDCLPALPPDADLTPKDRLGRFVSTPDVADVFQKALQLASSFILHNHTYPRFGGSHANRKKTTIVNKLGCTRARVGQVDATRELPGGKLHELHRLLYQCQEHHGA